MCAFCGWLIPGKEGRRKKKYASKICLPTRRGWRFFKSVTWYSPQSRISPSCPAYPGCHTQAAGLNCRESAYLSNRITRKEYGHICLSESDGPHVGCNDTWHHPADPQGIIRPSHHVQQQQQQQQHWCADDDIHIWQRQHKFHSRASLCVFALFLLVSLFCCCLLSQIKLMNIFGWDHHQRDREGEREGGRCEVQQAFLNFYPHTRKREGGGAEGEIRELVSATRW